MNNHSPRKPTAARTKPVGTRTAGKTARQGAKSDKVDKVAKQAAPQSDKRQRILDAAVRVFAEEGFYNSKVSQIAEAAGVADGTIYLYFKSKDDLLISLFEDRMDSVNAELRRTLGSPGSAIERLRQIIALHFELVEANPAMAEVICVELRQSSKFIKEYANPKFAEYLRILAGCVADGQAAGILRADIDPQLVARSLFGALDEIALSWLVKRDKFELQRAADQMGRLFIEGLRAR